MAGRSFDLIVVGGGVFGLSTALEAGRRRRQTLADAHLETIEANARLGGAKVRWLGADGLRREFPQFRRGHRALLEEEAGFLRTTDCVTALRELAEKHGVQFVTGHDAAVARSGSGVEVRMDTATYRAPQVVVAAGGWSKRLFPELGRALWQCQQGIMYLEGVHAAFSRPAFVPYSGADTGFYGFPAEPGRAGFKLARHLVTDPIGDPDFDRRTTPSGFVEAADEFVRGWFGLDPGDYRATYESCMYNLSTSNDFLLDFHPDMAGVFLATAGSGHGFKFGSLLGRIVLDRLDGIQSDRWTPQFSYDSFLSASSRPRLL